VEHEVYDLKLDMGSDVKVVSPKLVDVSRKCISLEDKKLRCPTGEKVPVKFRSLIKVELRKYSSKIFV